MMRFVLYLVLVLGAVGKTFAETSDSGVPMTAQAMKSELFGIRVSGVELESGDRWSECIEPGGRTLYEIGDFQSEGHLEISAKQEACFTYPSGTSCFRVQRAGEGYMLSGSGHDGGFYLASTVERGIRSCFASELVG
ncbi:MAG: hypothetical protein RLO80_07720 [Hyphomonas sp.]